MLVVVGGVSDGDCLIAREDFFDLLAEASNPPISESSAELSGCLTMLLAETEALVDVTCDRT